jgi:conjugal transfer pilus assembly protein TraI
MGLALRAPQAILHANADLIDRLRLHAATDEAQFQERFIGPLLRLAEFINVVPATATTLFSGEMGLFRASLEAGFFAFQASDGRIFTGAEGVERRHALEGRWRYLCFLAALFHPIGKPLERLTVTGPDGQTWKRHFSGITTWAEGAGATRLFVSWGGPDADDSIGPSSVTLQVLPAIVGAENLQMLQDGAAELVSDLYKLAIGEAGTSRIAQQVVTACWDRIARREAARRPQAYGRLTSGTHQGPYLAGALRAMVESGQWRVNESPLSADRSGAYLEWPRAAEDLIRFGREKGYAGWPHDAPTLAALLKASNLVEDGGTELGLTEVVTSDGEIKHALKVANPLAVLEDYDPASFEGRPEATLAGVLAADPLARAEAAAAERAATTTDAPQPARGEAGNEETAAATGATKSEATAGAVPPENEELADEGQPAAAERDDPAPTRARPKRAAAGAEHGAVSRSEERGGKLREAPEVRYADLVPEDIRSEIGAALQVEILGKIVKAWRDRGENSSVMRRIDNGAAIEFAYLATQMSNVPTWVDTMARVGLIYSPPSTPGLRIQKVPIPEGRQPVQAVVLSNLACRRLGL